VLGQENLALTAVRRGRCGGGVSVQGALARTATISGGAGPISSLSIHRLRRRWFQFSAGGRRRVQHHASATTAFNIDAADPLLAAGDVLNVNFVGTTGVAFLPGLRAPAVLLYQPPTSQLRRHRYARRLRLRRLADTGIGTSVNNYNTLLIDDGPRHFVGTGLFLGQGSTLMSMAYSPVGQYDNFDDGVQFTTSLVASFNAVARVTPRPPAASCLYRLQQRRRLP